MWKFLLIPAGILIFVFIVFFGVYRVSGESMCPTINPGDLVIVKKSFLSEIKPSAGDLVVFQSPLDGELNIKKCSVVSDSMVFVTGENLPESTDSRHFGRIPTEDLMGIVLFY